MNTGEYGNVAEQESHKMEIQSGFGAGIEQLKTQSYTVEQLGSIKKNLSELVEQI